MLPLALRKLRRAAERKGKPWSELDVAEGLREKGRGRGEGDSLA